MAEQFFYGVDAAPLYRAFLVFYGLYPVLMAIVWVVLGAVYFRRREVNPEKLAPAGYLPFVSIVIPAFNEEATMRRTLEALLTIDYPDYEVIVVNDCSSDGTAAIVRQFVDGSGRVRLLDKKINEGKAMALNDALPVCRGEILVCLDADIVVTPGVVRALVPHFASPRVAAVTGNPRVANRGSLLRDLQTIEFSSIISVQRRAQRIWGRVLTVSGAVMAIRRRAIVDVGGFSPSMATEDIDLTWKLQRAYWDVRYEPSAVVWMEVPPNMSDLWKQRRRWARGLAQVLRRHAGCLLSWKQRRMWPIFGEAILSILWAYTFVIITTYWIVANMLGHSPLGSSPIPNMWGMLMASACLVQLFVGAWLDRRYDPKMLHYFPVAIFYPLIYWTLMAFVTAIYTIGAFVRRPPQVQRWNTRRAT